MTSRPAEREFAPHFRGYVSLVPESDILDSLEQQAGELTGLMGSVTPGRETYRYASGKWSIREVMGHLNDGERVFGYRAFCISRGETASLPGFDENRYVAESGYNDRPLADLVAEFVLLRKSNLSFLRRLPEVSWARMGTASGHPASVRAQAFIMVGHVRHHFNGLRANYGLPAGA